MTTYTLSQVLDTQTTDEKLAELLATLTSEGFSATSWQDGSVQRTLIELYAKALSEQTTLNAAVANGGFLDSATGLWLSLLAEGFYGIVRTPAQSAVYVVTLTNSTAAPVTINEGALWVGTTSGLRYQNTASVTIAAGGQGSVSVRAESPGAQYNVGANKIIIMNTAVPGVTCTNASATPTTVGLDEQTDAALRQLCRDKWQSLGAGGTAGAYRYWAMTANANVAKVLAKRSVMALGTVAIYLAGQTSGVDAATVSDVSEYIVDRCPLCVTPAVGSATTQTVNVSATAYVQAAYAGAYSALAIAAVNNVFVGLDIGDDDDTTTTDILQLSDINLALRTCSDGVDNVIISTPTADVEPATEGVLLVPNISITVVPV